MLLTTSAASDISNENKICTTGTADISDGGISADKDC